MARAFAAQGTQQQQRVMIGKHPYCAKRDLVSRKGALYMGTSKPLRTYKTSAQSQLKYTTKKGEWLARPKFFILVFELPFRSSLSPDVINCSESCNAYKDYHSPFV